MPAYVVLQRGSALRYWYVCSPSRTDSSDPRRLPVNRAANEARAERSDNIMMLIQIRIGCAERIDEEVVVGFSIQDIYTTI